MEPTQLLILAQTIMDKFYQDYAPRDGFFTLSDFVRDTAYAYQTLFDDMFQQEKNKTRALEGFSYVEISQEILVDEPLDIKTDPKTKEVYALLTQPVFPFKFDSVASGLVSIRKIKGACSDMIKITPQDAWAAEKTSRTSKSFYYLRGNDRIVFVNAHCLPAQASAQYVPAVIGNEDKCLIANALCTPIMTTVLQLCLGAKNGTIIKKEDDGNPNATPQNQQNERTK